MPVSPLRRLVGGRKPNATSASPANVAEQMSNRLELADLRRLHARMLLDRGGTGDRMRAPPRCSRRRWPPTAHFGMPAYAAEAERLRSQRWPSGVCVESEHQPRRSAASNGAHRARSSAPARSGSATKDRADSEIGELEIAPRMINGRCRMVAGGVDGGWQPSAESLHADCHVLAVGTDHRQIRGR